MKIFSENLNRENFLSGVDARVKLVVTLALLAMVLSYKGVMFPLCIAAGSFSICLMMRVPPRILGMRVFPPMVIALLVLVLKGFFTGSENIFSVHIFGLDVTGSREGLAEGLQIMSRIVGGVSLVIVLGFATPFIEFMAALSWLRIPRSFIEVMMFAYRYLFVFLEDATTIYSAQKNRLGYSGIKKGLSSFGVLTGSLVLRGFEQSQKTADAMAQRGYTGDIPLLKRKPFRARELMVAACIVIFGGAVWMI